MLRDENPIAADRSDADGERCGLTQRRRRVVHRAVGDIESGQLDDHRLVFEEGLEKPLCDLGLILGVTRQELRSRREVIDHRRDVVIVVTATEELDEVVVGAERPVRELPNRSFVPRRDPEAPVEPNVVRDIEECLLAFDTDRVEHRRRLGAGVRGVGTTVGRHGCWEELTSRQ